MTDRYSLIAFCAILLAVCYLATVAAVLAAQGKYAEALGFGGLSTGLVGVLGALVQMRKGPDDQSQGPSQ